MGCVGSSHNKDTSPITDAAVKGSDATSQEGSQGKPGGNDPKTGGKSSKDYEFDMTLEQRMQNNYKRIQGKLNQNTQV